MKTKKIITVAILLFAGQISYAQKYRHIGNTPFQIQLPNDYFQESNAFVKNVSGYVNFSSSKEYIRDKTLTEIDTIAFRKVSSLNSDLKIIKFEKLKIGEFNATYIESQDRRKKPIFHLYIFHEKECYSLQAMAGENKLDAEEQKKTILGAKFDPSIKPDAVKDFSYKFDASILTGMVPNMDNDYPQISFKDEKYVNSLKIDLLYKKYSADDRKTIAQNMTFTFLKEDLITTVNDIEIDGLTGKEVIHKGKGYDGETELNYRLILFDTDLKFFILIHFDSKKDITRNLEMIQKFVKTIQVKNSKINDNNILGNWKITKIEEAGESEKCSDKITGKTIKITEKEISYTFCENDKSVEKKLKYEIKDGVLEIFDRTEFAGEMADVTYTNQGYVCENIAIIYFWKIGLVTMEKIK
jgi:hypothetical protein